MGLCKEGQAGKLIDAKQNTYGGRWVVNPSGGLISKGHPLGATGLGEKAPEWARDHSFVRDSVDKCVVDFPEISTVTEVQVYYRDDGHLVLKVDVSMNPELTIKEAHITSIKLRELIEDSLPGVAAVDVDLELDEYEMADLLDKDNMGYGVSYNSGCSSKGSIGSRKLSTKFGHSLNDPSSKYH